MQNVHSSHEKINILNDKDPSLTSNFILSQDKINILITGHCGYIGSALIKYLADEPFVRTIRGYDILDGDDILDCDKLIRIMTIYDIHLVIHLAALSSVTICNENPLIATKINGYGTNCILRAMKETGCKHIIYASTSSVYGDQKSLPYTEDMKLSPCSAYGISKLLGEHAIYNHYDLQGNDGSYLIFRMFNVVGSAKLKDVDAKANPGYDRLFAALESGKITIYGHDYDTRDGTCERDYVSLKDVCKSYIDGIRSIINKNRVRSTINICSGEPISVKYIIYVWNYMSACIRDKDAGYEKCNQLPLVNYKYGSRRLGDPAKVYGSNTKALKVINWKPKRKIERIIFGLALDKKFEGVHATK